MRVISPCGEDTHTLRLTSELVDLRVGYTKRIRRADARRATSLKLRRYDARCCIISTEGYRSGHNEAVFKTSFVCLCNFLKSLDFVGFFAGSSALCEKRFSQFSRNFP